MTKYLEIMQHACKILEETGFTKDIAKKDVEEILLHICHFDRAKLISSRNEEIPETFKPLFQAAINSRLHHKPIQYITHNANFCGYSFFVNEDCLIPRVDSEILVENAFEYVKNNIKLFKNNVNNHAKIKILDACCGSGCLGLSLCRMISDKKLITLGDIEITLLDKSSLAIQVAKINAQKLQINANFVISDVLVNYFGDQRYDIILCNPPYIETDVIDTLEPEVKNYEPKIALDGVKDGLLFYKALAKNLKENLNPNSKVFFEIGYNQGSIVEEIYKNENFKVELLKDYGNNDRCVVVSL